MRHYITSVCFTGKNEDAVKALRGVCKPSALLLKTGHVMPLFLNVQRQKPADQVPAYVIATKEIGKQSKRERWGTAPVVTLRALDITDIVYQPSPPLAMQVNCNNPHM